MTKIFIDSNIFIYLLASDQPNKQAEIIPLISQIEAGRIKPFTSNIVILEVIYTLRKHYRQNRLSIIRKLSIISRMRNLNIIESTDTHQALDNLSKHNIKSGDCFILTQIPPNTTLVTYDSDFQKIPHLDSQTPTQFLSSHH